MRGHDPLDRTGRSFLAMPVTLQVKIAGWGNSLLRGMNRKAMHEAFEGGPDRGREAIEE
jgi:hypothetical protein